MRDSFGRTIDYLRISVTDKCNLRCRYCMPAWGVVHRRHDEVLRIEEYLAVVTEAAKLGITKVRLTGGEPLVRRGIVELVAGIAEVPGIEIVAVTTNGTRLTSMARPLYEAGLTHLNISIDTMDPERYSIITRGGRLEHAVAGALAARDVGFERIKINVVAGRDWVDSADRAALETFCRRNGFALQRIAEYELTARRHDTLRFERPLPCETCNRIRLLSTGRLKPCLHSDHEIPVDFDDIAASLQRAALAKPERGTACTNRGMVEIGG
ncbi:MAG: radical SAM protein [Spirochaetales bacterium]|nr:radical SAM protein [Spirochaetales bacterium]